MYLEKNTKPINCKIIGHIYQGRFMSIEESKAKKKIKPNLLFYPMTELY